MDKKDISLLVLNSIKDEKRIIDNYDFYNDTDSEGLNSDFFKAKCYMGCLENYYAGSPRLEDVLSFLHSYYEPYRAEFEVIETPDMKKAKKFTRGCLYGTAISTVITAFVDVFFPIAFATSTIALISHLYVKTREMQRAGTLKHLKINDAEAKSITKQDLSDALNSEKETMLEALAKDYTF
ncbi:MAG: hypothetical protein AABX27_01685 [Nanoarchaeota archaeon]